MILFFEKGEKTETVQHMFLDDGLSTGRNLHVTVFMAFMQLEKQADNHSQNFSGLCFPVPSQFVFVLPFDSMEAKKLNLPKAAAKR